MDRLIQVLEDNRDIVVPLGAILAYILLWGVRL